MSKIILNIKPFQETLNNSYCGPAALKIVFGYYGINRSEEELAKISEWDKDLGIDDKSIKKTGEQLGFKVKIKNNSTFENIESWLKKGIPVIVNWFTRGRSDYLDSAVPDGHYSVVAGLDDRFIYLQDPEIGKIRKLDKEDFLAVWFDFTGKHIKPNELIVRQIIAIYR